MHASKGLEPDTHKRLSMILEEELPEQFRSEIVVVSGPAMLKTIVRDITLITAASKDLETAKYVQNLFTITTSACILIQMSSVWKRLEP